MCYKNNVNFLFVLYFADYNYVLGPSCISKGQDLTMTVIIFCDSVLLLLLLPAPSRKLDINAVYK